MDCRQESYMYNDIEQKNADGHNNLMLLTDTRIPNLKLLSYLEI